MSDNAAEFMKALWREQPATPVPVAPEVVRRRAGGLNTVIRRRNRLEYAATILVVILFGAGALFLPGESPGTQLIRAGCVLDAMAAIYVAWQLHRRAGAGEPDLADACLSYYVAELERQRDALRSVWSWYLAPFVPGMGLIFLGGHLNSPDEWQRTLLSTGFAAAVFIAVGWLNNRTAARMDDEIRSLSEEKQASCADPRDRPIR